MTVEKRIRLQFVLSDYVTINVAWLLFDVIRYFSLPEGHEMRSLWTLLTTDPYILLGQIVNPLMMLGLYWLSGFYNRVMDKSRIEEIGNTALVSLAGTLLIFFTTLVNDNVPERLYNYEIMMILWLLLLLPTLVGRLVITGIHSQRSREAGGLYDALLLGPEADTRALAERLSRGERHEFRPVARIVTDGAPASDGGLKSYGPERIDEALAACNPQAIIIASDSEKILADNDMITRLFRSEADVYISVGLSQAVAVGRKINSVVNEPLVNISRANIPEATRNLKRAGDVVLSALALVALAPVFAVVAVLVKRDSPGPVFYRQERVGYHKKLFKIIKFRTMRTDAEASGPALSSASDPRVTPFGRVMRKYRIDELPQFWNVLKGEMSIVGPRPEREYFVRRIAARVPQYSLIHQVRPGITSWGMVRYGYAMSVDEMVERLRYDLLYLDNVSFGVDAKILLHTVHTVLTGRGM